MLITAVQQSASVLHRYTLLSHALFHYNLSRDIEYSSLCCAVGPCCISIACTCLIIPNSHCAPLPPPAHLATTILVFMSLILFPLHRWVHLSHILDSACKWYYMILVFLFLTSLRTIISSYSHVATNGVISFFLWLSNFPSYVSATSSLSSPLLMDRGCFPVLAIVNSAAMHLSELQFCLWICPGVGLPDHVAILFLVFWGASILYSAFPSTVSKSSLSPQPFQHLLCVDFLMMAILTIWHKAVPPCSFDLLFSNNQWCWASFHVPTGHLFVFFGEVSV